MKQWKNIKIGGKMLIGFGLLMLLLLVISVWSILGIREILSNNEKIKEDQDLNELLLEREIDHLLWAASLNTLITNDEVHELNIQLDDHQCALGKWLYGEGREQAERIIPTLALSLSALEEPHRLLHVSAQTIDSLYTQADRSLPAVLAERQIEHLKWAGDVRDALLRNEKTIEVQKDHEKCNLGLWIQSQEAAEIYNAAGPDFQGLWKDMLESHRNLHASIYSLEETLTGSAASSMGFFESETLPLLNQTLGYIDNLKGIAQSNLANLAQATDVYYTETQPALEEVKSLISEMRDEAHHEIQINEENINSAITRTVRLIVIISAVSFLTGIILAFIITKGITESVFTGIRFAQTLSGGDLTADIQLDQKDEIGQLAKALKEMRNSLVGIVSEVKNSAGNISSGSMQLSSASQQLAQGASEQASSAEQISSAMEQMGANIEQNSDNSIQTEAISRQAANTVEEGSQAVMEMVDAMKNITEKISIIEEIARSTNMLSLNAAIEAARAGEHGKGFAVVAAEVGKLAANSNAAAKEISELASGSVQQAIKTGELMREIVPKIKNTADLIQEISASSKEQRTGANQVVEAINQFDRVIQQNASSSEESASMAEELASQAEALQQMMAFFQMEKQEQSSGAQLIEADVEKPMKKIEDQTSPETNSSEEF